MSDSRPCTNYKNSDLGSDELIRFCREGLYLVVYLLQLLEKLLLFILQLGAYLINLVVELFILLVQLNFNLENLLL